MLGKIEIENFRCLKDVRTELEPFTVLLGPNAAGKTTFLEALNPTRKILLTDHWQKKSESNQVSFQFYDIQDTELLKRSLLTFARGYSELVPVYGDVDVRPFAAGPGMSEILFQDRWDENLWYDVNQVSDGTLIMLAYLILQFVAPSPDVVAIEEPERGLHPYLIAGLVDMLRAISRGEIGQKPTQFILASHSPQLLDYLKPEEVRFFSRSEDDGAVVIEKPPTTSPEWEQAFKEYEESLGGMWLSGGLGGVP